MKVIGISLGYNTSVAVVSQGGIEIAISEERLTGVKNTKTFPLNALKMCIDKMMESADVFEPIRIAISSYEVINERTLRYFEYDTITTDMRNTLDEYGFYAFLKEYIEFHCFRKDDYRRKIIIKRVDHHTAHALPAIYLSGYLNSPISLISVTADGFGDGLSATIRDAKTNEILAFEPIDTSLGLVYQYVTGSLGFKEHQHEGKITGLAAFGEPKYVEYFKQVIGYDPQMMSFIPYYLEKRKLSKNDGIVNRNIHGFKNMLELKAQVYHLVSYLKKNKNASDADIAASVQSYTEMMITTWAKDVLNYNGYDLYNIVLSGGLFANVKVNYQMKKVLVPRNLYVLPPMGDEGTSVGAAISYMINSTPHKEGLFVYAFADDNLYYGSSITKDVIANINEEKYEIININELGEERLTNLVAQLLADDNIVCVSRGGSEFGPRALGNHSILYDASFKETNDSLNARLSRSEFMPFAPITIDKYAHDLFKDLRGLEKTVKYMTIAVPVTDEFVEGYKAAYHVDNTARPQVLVNFDNPIIYNIIDKYSQITNKKALINTSFNLHNSPIIYSNQVAYDSFVKADLDALLLEDILLVRRGEK